MAAFPPARLLWGARLTVLGTLAILLFPSLLSPSLIDQVATTSARTLDPRLAVIVLIACSAPGVLARLCYGLINRKSVAQRVRLQAPAGLDRATADRVLASWNYEICRSHWQLSRPSASRLCGA